MSLDTKFWLVLVTKDTKTLYVGYVTAVDEIKARLIVLRNSPWLVNEQPDISVTETVPVMPLGPEGKVHVGVLTEVLKYADHKYNCDWLQPMWHKGPCDCGWQDLEQELIKCGFLQPREKVGE